MFLTEDEVLMTYKDTDQNISAKSLTLLALQNDHNPNTSQ